MERGAPCISTLPESVDIFIIGAGPTGLSLMSELLHQRALGRIALLDANVEPCGGSLLPKGQGILASTFELWARWGDGTLPKQIASHRVVPERMQPVFNTWDSEARCVRPGGEPQQTDPSLTAWGSGGRVQQPFYEGVLRKHIEADINIAADATQGSCHGSVHYGWRVLNVERDTTDEAERGWIVQVAANSGEGITHYAAAGGSLVENRANHASEETISIRAAVVVGCDGGRSLLRHELGIKYSGKGALGASLTPIFRSKTLYKQLRQQFAGASDGIFYSFKKPGCPMGAVGILEGEDTFYGQVAYKSRDDVPAKILEAQSAGDNVQLARLAVETLEKHCDCDFKWEDVEALEGFLWTPYSLCAQRWMTDDGTAILAGDAAHLLSPQGGFGMNGGVADGVALGWRLAGQLNGWFGPRGSAAQHAALSSYESERKRAWDRYNSFQEAAVAEGQNNGSRSVGAAYELAALGPSSRVPVVGERATDCILDSGKRLHQFLATCKGYTLILSKDDDAADVSAKRFLEAAHSAGVPAVVRCLGQDAVFAHTYSGGTIGPNAFVFRPDQVLAWQGQHEDLLTTSEQSFVLF